MQPLLLESDANGRPTAALPCRGHHLAVLLQPATAKAVSVPAGAQCVVFAATDDVWVGFDRPAFVPAADVVDGSAPELNPAARTLAGTATIALAAPRACTVGLTFYR